METLEAINSRRSIRKYLDRPVEFEKLTTILDAARRAPSAGNLQDWRFILVTDRELIRQTASYCVDQHWIATAPALIVVCAIPEKHEIYYGLRGKKLYNIQDCAAAIQNILLVSTDVGLGSCWIGAFEEDKLKSLFGIPPDVRPQAIITIGYADEVPNDRELSPIESMVYFNRYGLKIEKLHIVLRDYSVEWQRQGEKFKDRARRGWARFKERMAKMRKNRNNNNRR